MKNSIRFKLTLLLIILMSTCIFLVWFISNYMMKSYFVMDLKSNLQSTYEDLDAMFSDEDFNEENIKENFPKVSSRSDTVILVIHYDGDEDNPQIYSTTNEKGKVYDSLLSIVNLVQGSESSENVFPGVLASPPELMIGNEHYVIQQTHDIRLDSSYYDLIGKLSNGDIVAIRSSVKRVDDSVKVASRLFGFVGIFVTILGSIAMLIVSNKFAKPIHNMAIIAKRMSNLDFDAKVVKISNDEIGDLGKSMNEMSYRLEQTISELKSANNELRNDIESKTQIDEMRKEFLSHVSHELKTPIALIQGYAEGLIENISDDKESRDFYCEVIADEANKMNIMVKKLLALNEIECGTGGVKFERFNIVELIKNIISSSEIFVNQNDITIIFEENSPIYVWADEFMIEGVISNYISNAIHHTVKDGTIKVFLERVDNELKILVYNKGENIPEEDIDKVWIKFYKVDKARTREYGGNGIGLSIVAASMDAHGKEYGVYNVPDGVVFYILLDTDMPC